MKKYLAALLLTLACVHAQAAQRGYVSDRLEVQMRSGPSLQNKILKMLPSGTPLTVIEGDESSGYSLVSLDSGEQGWILSRYLSAQPAARAQIEENTRKSSELGEENKRLKAELAELRAGKENAEKNGQELDAETKRLNTEVIAIRQASANALQIQAERDQLQEKVIGLERDLEKTRREMQAQDADVKQDWFLIGAGVLIGGIVLGLVLPRLSWRKRSSWNSF
ncbi:TIGR04211 family SH3 domain-containing protein [Methylococcus sp. EFPC2]|uniref:TIGR04211 family SH3 domain-containing protein n=1 Tax=Methylococcus sp. EFPC2 TaxID=2812648 RepID=UPI0019671F7D|nr:TIGR04211 family SH3 domain-containing protein [Methylococcus sp. EFPC2]QSA97205.1 TIGR04211 family SH3 domain-containing protein [Methylococcus sp. EFPC2]